MHWEGLEKNDANYVPLSPLSFLRAAARVYPQRCAVIYGKRRLDWQAFALRCGLLARALSKRGVGEGDVVSFVAANTPELLEAHFGVPMAGAVLNAINTRLDEDTLRYIFNHAESKAVFVDGEFAPKVAAAVKGLENPPFIVDITDSEFFPEGGGKGAGECDYESFLQEANGEELFIAPRDEWRPIALNYTSGTTGRPKGVVYHHRGAYLMSLGSAVGWHMPRHPVYLYTVPMFHCNGWGYAWTNTMLAGAFVLLRKVDGAHILKLIAEHGVEYMGGAPIVLSLLGEAAQGARLPHPVKLITAGAPPPPAVIAKMEAMGFSLIHAYGLTESYGHTMQCPRREEWDSLPAAERAEKQAQQGVGYPILEDWAVLDKDGRALYETGAVGEIAMRGNTIMSGYLKNPEATGAAFANGWFKTGDLAQVNEFGHLQIKDRLKDVIISGGENIPSIAVEAALCRHPAVLLAAVVAKPDEKWGETPCAFVELRGGAESPTPESLSEFCREHLPGFMRPRYVVFGELPKTATGKIKKYELRARARELDD